MARIFKRSRNRSGKKEKSSIWYIEFADHFRIRRRLSAFSDKSASEAAGRQLDKLVALRMAGESPDAALTTWLETCPTSMVEKLGEWGVLTKERTLAGKPLLGHVDDWREALLAKGTGEERARDSKSRVMKLFTACEFRTWSDIDALHVEKLLSEWQKDGILAAQTRKGPTQNNIFNHY